MEETPKKCKDIIKTARSLLNDIQFAQFGDDPKVGDQGGLKAINYMDMAEVSLMGILWQISFLNDRTLCKTGDAGLRFQ